MRKKKHDKNKEIKTSGYTTRRRVLKTLAAGAGAAVWHSSLPQTWVKPIIESVVLPVHAQTSAPLIPDDCTIVLMFNDTTEATMTALPAGDNLPAGPLAVPEGMTGIRVNNITTGRIEVRRTSTGGGGINEILEIGAGEHRDYIIGVGVHCDETLSVSRCG
ncbi:MAG: twin-arginine translocation signal domain-containing protein [Candidatus Electrothrix sp. YB6]